MGTLIFEKGVVQERTDLHPVTGCWRVVYEKQGEGARFLQVLGEEEAFSDERSGLFKKVVYKTFAAGPEYLVYAVSQDRHLMLEFFRRVAHQNQLNHFDLYFKVEYHVSDPKVLVTRLRTLKEDVLDKLRDTIGDEISGASARIPWESIKDEYLFSEVVDDLTDPDRSLFRRLQSKAHDSGLALTDIKLSLRLLEIDVTEPKRDFEHQRDLAQKRRDLSLTQANEDIKDLTKIRELRRQTWEGGTKAITASLEKIADDTDTAAKLRDNLNEIGGVFFPQIDTPGVEAPSLPEKSSKPLADVIKCTVFAPPIAFPGKNTLVQVFAHLAENDEVVECLATKFDEKAKLRAAKQLNNEVERGSELTFCLSLHGVEIDEPIQKLTWRGQPEAVQFGVYIPENHKGDNIIGTIYVSQNSIPFGHVKFKLRVVAASNILASVGAQSGAMNAWKRYEHAFISYASADRPEVLKRVQMLPRFHINFFQDLLTLEPGERWEKAIYKYIDKSDVFFLFWSTAAKNSEWVMKEVRYAIERKGEDEFAAPEIVPIIIEGPPPVPPPVELGNIHFNDTFIYLINAR